MILALVILASASFNAFAASDKKKKKDKKTPPQQEQVVLRTPSDTVSYAAGKASTEGLMPYLQQEYQLDTAYLADFIAGYKDALARGGDPQYKAYSAGIQIARMVAERILPNMQSQFKGSRDSITADLFNAGFLSSLNNDTTYYTQPEATSFIRNRIKQNREEALRPWRIKNEKWLADNKTKPGVQTTASGLQYKVITKGNGPIPTKDDRVTVKYEGKLIDGTVFDSSLKRNPPTSEFGVKQVIKGWTEALCMMPEGSKWELYIPQDIAYGSRQSGQIKPYSTLIFTVELVKVKPKAKPATATEKKATDKPADQTAKKTSKRK